MSSVVHDQPKISTDGAQEDQVQMDLNVDITVLRADALPKLTRMSGGKRKIYATISGNTSKKGKVKRTKALVYDSRNSVEWKEEFQISVPPTSQISISLYAKHLIHDVYIGSIEIGPIFTTEGPFTLKSRYVPPPVVLLTIGVRRNAESQVIEQNTPRLSTPTTDNVDGKMIADAQAALEETASAVRELKICNEWKETVQNIQWVMHTVDELADIHPLAKAAWEIVSLIPEAFLAQFDRDDNIIFLVETMHSAYNLTQAEELLKSIKPNSNLALIFKVMLKHINICGGVIKRYAKDKEFSKRLLANITGKVNDEIKDLCDTLQRLRRDLVYNAIINIQIANHVMQKSMKLLTNEVSNMIFDANINELPYKSGWSHTANKSGCLEGTRADFLEYILEWIENPLSVRGLVIFGQAGTGKSSIAFEIASRFCFQEHPASYFSFSRLAEESERKDHHLFTTIIRDMSDRYPSFKRALGETIANNTPLRQSDDFSQLFNTLLLTPLEKIGPNATPELIVIDAIDESGDPQKLAAFLSQSLIRLPQNFRILITSRSESDIEDCFSIIEDTSVAPYETIQMDDPKLAAKIEDDIRLYFQNYLTADMFKEYGEELARKAEGLFQWAAVACGYINKPPPGFTDDDCLRGLRGREESDRPYTQELQSTKLYKLYDQVLSGYFTSTITRPRFCSVMGQLLAALEPVSVNTLTNLRRFMPGDRRDRDLKSVLAVIKYLGSLLSNATSSDRDLPIVPLHTSFRDYLIDDTKKHLFSVDLAAAHRELTCACLDLMLDPHGLRFNIVELESSHLPNDKVKDLQSRIKTHISPSLFYATRFWDDHLKFTTFDKTILQKLEVFFKTKFLFWLEVLSVTETVPLAVPAITSLIPWLQPGLNVSEPEVVGRVETLLGVVADAHKFVRYFGNVIATSAPHIYVSALPFAPKSSTIYKFYSSKFSPTMSFKRGQLANWPALEISIPTSSTPRCAAFSPDGQWIAAGLDDHTICLWNATTGKLEGKPFTGHTNIVKTVAFSPDGLHVLSGAYDSTIRMWNVGTGTIVGEPWIGHKDMVYSVAFSPDGRWAISGSFDKTIRLWDVAKGTIVGQPLEGHEGAVYSVAFLPDGKRIASGSDDATIRVWKLNVDNGAVEGGPLILHTLSGVTSLAFSPDGQRMVSRTDDTIHIWDNLAGPQAQVTHQEVELIDVKSVNYSPDGLNIVAGTDNGMIYLWNTNTKQFEYGPFIGHTSYVWTVAFSPDGQRIVSAGYDDMIHVWDTVAAKRIVEGDVISETRAMGEIRRIAVSPLRANLIALAGNDGKIFLWDIDTDKLERPSLVGHTDTILSIQFSPNGLQLVSASQDHTVRLWNVEEGTMVGQPFTGHAAYVHTVAFSPDGRRIVSGSRDCTIRVWNAVTGMLEGSRLIGHDKSVNSVQFSPDGRRVVSGSDDCTVRIWDIDKGSQDGNPFTAHDRLTVMFAAFLAGGEKILSCSHDSTVLVWDVATRIVKGRFRLMDPPYLSSFACMLSADGTTFLAADLDYEGGIAVWNVATQTIERGPLREHTYPVSCLAFSPHKPYRLVSCGFDSTVRVWDLASLFVDRGVPVAHASRPEIDIKGIDVEGWLRGTNGELVVWIPRHYRSSYKFPKHVALYPPDRVVVNFLSFIHGRDWYSHYNL